MVGPGAGAVDIRPARPAESAAIEALYPAAFPDEDLVPLVRALLAGGEDVRSLVAMAGADLAGHVAFTRCAVDGSDRPVALLGPLAVAPDCQGRGIGGALVRAGLAAIGEAGMRQMLVLGDPAYYRRFGFTPERRIVPPYTIPDDWRDAWQSLPLAKAAPAPEGRLQVPAMWRVPAYWGA